MKLLGRVLSVGALLVLQLSALLPVPAQAAGEAVAVELSDVAAGADAVVIGTVVRQASAWNPEHTRISTTVTLSVEESLKGAVGRSSLVVTAPGGTAEGITEWVSDAPVFVNGERAVVFLKSRPQNRFEVYGSIQGKYTIHDGMVNGMPLAEFRERVRNPQTRAPASPAAEMWQPAGPMRLDLQPPVLSPQPAPRSNFFTRFLGGMFADADESVTTAASDVKAGLTPILNETFEGVFPSSGWTVVSAAGTPKWGLTNYTASQGSWSLYCARDGTGGVDPTMGYYSNGMNTWAKYGPMDLSGVTAAQLTFDRSVKTEVNDRFWVLASVDGTNWLGYYWAGGTGSWLPYGFDLRSWGDLGNLCGQSQVHIAFAFQSDSSGVDKGVFIDNIQVTTYSAPIPSVSGVNPTQASAGTNSPITITGTGFGAAPGTVSFFYRSGRPYVTGSIVSWSDTSITTLVPVGLVDGYPASVSSGFLQVANADTVPSYPNTPFTVTFGYGGVKWAGDAPTIDFYINPNTPDCTDEEMAVQEAAATWTAVSNKDFRFNYAGATDSTGYGENGVNEVLWRDLGTIGTLAHAMVWYDEGTGIIYETDIEFNDNYTWSTATTLGEGQHDVESIALHEMGHWLNLRDLYGNLSGYPQDVDKAMHGFVVSGATKRALHADDIAGIRWIYPTPTSATPIISLIAASADGRTVFAYDDTANVLYKSTDSGDTWGAPTALGTAGETVNGVDLVVSPSFGTDSTVVFVETDATAGSVNQHVWMSTDGGATFTDVANADLLNKIEQPAGGAITITSVDAGMFYTGQFSILIGVKGGTGGATSNVLKFALGGSTWDEVGNIDAGGIGDFPVLDVKFSPGHMTDAEIMAVYTRGGDTWLSSRFGALDWNAFIPAVDVTGSAAGAAASAVIAAGTDYVGNTGAPILVGLSGSVSDDVYRITGRSAAAGISADLNIAGAGTVTSVTRIAVAGPLATATVLVGGPNAATIRRGTTVTATAVWDVATKSPNGAAVTGIVWAGADALAATTGVDGGLFKSTDAGNTWNVLSLPNTRFGITTSLATAVTATGARLNGTLDPVLDNTELEAGFEWGETTDYGHATTPETVSEPTGFSATITGLTPNRLYHFRARAQAVGQTEFVYGEDMTFTTKRQFTLTVDVTGNGITDPLAGDHAYTEATTVDLLATPATGWRFVNWTGDVADPTSPSTSVTMDASKTVTANFVPVTATLINALRQSPTAYTGRTITLYGAKAGWVSTYGPPPVTKSDWVFRDATGYVWVTGLVPPATSLGDGQPMQLTGVVHVRNGVPYIEVPRARRR